MCVPTFMAIHWIFAFISVKTTNINLMVELEEKWITKVIRIYHLATMNVWTRFCANLSGKWWWRSQGITKVSRMHPLGTIDVWETDIAIEPSHSMVKKGHHNIKERKYDSIDISLRRQIQAGLEQVQMSFSTSSTCSEEPICLFNKVLRRQPS